MDVQEQLLLKMIRQSPLLKLTRYTVYVRGERVHSFLEVSLERYTRGVLEIYDKRFTDVCNMYTCQYTRGILEVPEVFRRYHY